MITGHARRLSLRLTAVLLLLVAGSRRAPAQEGQVLQIRDVSIVDVRTGEVVPDRTVTVVGDRIASITGPALVLAGSLQVDGSGRFLIPGLWDMHGHALATSDEHAGEWWEPSYRTAFPLLVANGVTGVRDMWGTLGLAARVRRERARTDAPWPRLFTPGAIIDGPRPYFPGLVSVASATDARRAVDSLAAAGADFVKVYSALPGDLLRAVARHAAARGLPVAGHVPMAVRAVEAARAGMRSFEHLYGVLEGCSSEESSLLDDNIRFLDARATGRATTEGDRAYFQRLLATQDDARCRVLLQALAAHGVWQVPTLTAHRGVFRLRDPRAGEDPRLAYVHPLAQAHWQPASYDETRAFGADDWDLRRRRWERMLEVVRMMRDEGVPLLAGSDFHPTIAFTFPGFGLHEELELMVEAGLTPLEALQTATWNAAAFLEATDNLGSVEPGKLADLVLLEENPLVEIRATRSIHGVVMGGRWLDRDVLDDRLRAVADEYEPGPLRLADLPPGAAREDTLGGERVGLRLLFLVDPDRVRGRVPGFLEPFRATDLAGTDASAEAFLTANPRYRDWVVTGLDVWLGTVAVEGRPGGRAEARWWAEARGAGFPPPDPLPADVETRAELSSWEGSGAAGSRVTVREETDGGWAFRIDALAIDLRLRCVPGGARAPIVTPASDFVLVWQGGRNPDRYTVRTFAGELVRDCQLALSVEGLHPLSLALKEAPLVQGFVLGARLVEGGRERRGLYRVD